MTAKHDPSRAAITEHPQSRRVAALHHPNGVQLSPSINSTRRAIELAFNFCHIGKARPTNRLQRSCTYACGTETEQQTEWVFTKWNKNVTIFFFTGTVDDDERFADVAPMLFGDGFEKS